MMRQGRHHPSLYISEQPSWQRGSARNQRMTFVDGRAGAYQPFKPHN